MALAIVVEITGFIGSGILTWAMWHGTTPSVDDGTPTRARSDVDLAQIDVVVRVDQQPMHHVRATLLTLRSMHTGRPIVVDLSARPEIASIAAEFDAVYAQRTSTTTTV